jgi:hypothetical protein
MHKALAQKVKTVIDSAHGKSESIFKDLSEFVGKQPVRKVNYKDPEDDAIHEALFSKRLQAGEVVEPIELSNGDYLVMKVLDWTDYPLISGIDQQERSKKVNEKEHRILASKMWQSYQSKMMRGKKIEFHKKRSSILVRSVKEKYLTDKK